MKDKLSENPLRVSCVKNSFSVDTDKSSICRETEFSKINPPSSVADIFPADSLFFCPKLKDPIKIKNRGNKYLVKKIYFGKNKHN